MRRSRRAPQRRELWVVSCFFLTILLSLAAFVREGILIAWLHRLTLGLFGWGAYLLPLASLGCCVVILLARGKPVAARLTAVSMVPVLTSMAIHLLLCSDEYTWANCLQLYPAGQYLIAGGFIAGGLAELASSVFSHAGAVIAVVLLFIVDVLMICQVRLADITEYFNSMRDAGQVRRADPLYDEYDGNTRYSVQEAPEATEAEQERIRKREEERQARLERERQARLEREQREAARREAIRQRTEKREQERRPKSRTPDLPLEKEAPGYHPAFSLVTDETETLSEISRAARPDEHFVTGEPQSAIPSQPTAYAMDRWARDVPVLENGELNDPQVTVPPPKKSPKPRRRDESELPEADLPRMEDLPSLDELTNAADGLPSAGTADDAHVWADGAPWDEDFPKGPEDRDPIAFVPDKSADKASDKQTDKAAQDAPVVVVDTHQEKQETAPASAIEKDQAPTPQYEFPPVDLLKEDRSAPSDDATEELRMRSRVLTDTLQSFGVQARISGVIRGPSVTRYELQLERGVKLQRLTVLQNDIALALGATGVRIAPIPDKMAVGIEVPNKVVQIVYLREVLLSQNMSAQKSKIAFALGRDITGDAIVADIRKMPHLLIAGTTGSGKSVCINSIIVSLLYRATPQEVRFIMIDPKMVELGDYNGIPHLLIPVVTDYKKAPGTLAWAVSEMERRYKLMAAAGARDLASYNRMLESKGEEKLPSIVIIIDELADLMMVAAKEIEEAICRIAQKARAAGMHLIIATQRPSADVLTGLMKSNIPSRIAFAVASQVESRIILDQGGAEKLIGRGDMLFLPIGAGKPLRVQGCFLSDGEIEAITAYIKEHGTAEYSQEIIDQIENASQEKSAEADVDDEADPMLGDAVDVIMETGQASASMLQRRLKLGYARAARIIDQMEARGIIGPFDGSRPRQILISKNDWQEMKLRYGLRS